jgi:hypothetical protein
MSAVGIEVIDDSERRGRFHTAWRNGARERAGDALRGGERRFTAACDGARKLPHPAQHARHGASRDQRGAPSDDDRRSYTVAGNPSAPTRRGPIQDGAKGARAAPPRDRAALARRRSRRTYRGAELHERLVQIARTLAADQCRGATLELGVRGVSEIMEPR